MFGNRVMGTAIGIAPRTAWAWLVLVSGPRGAPRVGARVRVEACGGGEGHLYHRAAERTRDPVGFLDRERSAALARTVTALAPHLGEARAATVLGRRLALPPLPRILAAHPLLHAAEGELWRALFAEALESCGLVVERAEAAAVRTALEERHGAAALDAFLASGRAALGPPWGREIREAALAAWSAL